MMTNNEGLAKAIALLGGRASLARAIGVQRGMIWQWEHNGVRITPAACPLIEKATGGQVRCEELRPDISWELVRENA